MSAGAKRDTPECARCGAPVPAPGDWRPVPVNFEAEMALLGALLSNNRTYDRVAPLLRPRHFADPRHGRVYEAIGFQIGRGRIADPITLKAIFAATGELDDLGGTAYLARLAASVVTIINADDYARAIVDADTRRKLILFAEDTDRRAREDPLDHTGGDLIDMAEGSLFALSRALTTLRDEGAADFPGALDEAIARADAAYRGEKVEGAVPTGLAPLDAMFGGGLAPGQVFVAAGRPSMGKTTFAINVAAHAAQSGIAVDFFSLEMSRAELGNLFLARETGLAANAVRAGGITQFHFAELVAARDRLAGWPLRLHESMERSVSTVRAAARRGRPGLVIVDYLQLLAGADADRKPPENPVQRFTEISRALKVMALELACPVLVLSQLNREAERRSPPRPRLADLRETGAIEQDADAVLLFYRESYYVERREPEKDTAGHVDWEAEMRAAAGHFEIIVDKQRHGPVGVRTIAYDAATYRMADNAAGLRGAPGGEQGGGAAGDEGDMGEIAL